tara:strand:- start:494 stop:1480 length:987 start_codon:yes stop_codon:yes gene_type:complete
MPEYDKNIDEARLSLEQKSQIDWLSESEKRSKKVGFGGTFMQIPKPTLIKSGIEAIFPDENNDQSNAQIVITRDRPASMLSGYGGKGHQKCSTIDIVAGRVSRFSATSFRANNGEQVDFNVDPNFELDAARIYISEKTDIDANFNLREQKYRFAPSMEGRSAIGMKADAIRIIGNEGVRIVTGVYPRDSRGGKIARTGIELVCLNGNDGAFSVQPFVKGDNLVSSLNKLQEHIFKLNAMVMEFIKDQQHLNALFAAHNHNAPGTLAPTGPPALGTPDPFKQYFDFSNKKLDDLKIKLQKNSSNIQNWEKVYLSRDGKNWLLSRYNGTN